MSDGELTTGPDGELVVSTPLIDILDKLQTTQAAGFAEMRTSLLGKADKTDIDAIRNELASHHDRLSTIEQQQRDDELIEATRREDGDRILTKRQRFWAAIGTIAGMAAILLAALISSILQGH